MCRSCNHTTGVGTGEEGISDYSSQNWFNDLYSKALIWRHKNGCKGTCDTRKATVERCRNERWYIELNGRSFERANRMMSGDLFI